MEQIDEFDREEIDAATLEDWKVDSMLETVKENNEQIKKLKEIAEKRIEDIKFQFEQKKEKVERENHYILTTLKEYARTHKNLKEQKTQYKLPLLSGDIIIKKSKVDFKPKKDQEEVLIEDYPELVKVKEVKSLKLKDIKRRFVLVNHKIIDTETGEDVTDKFEIVEKPEEIIVK